MRLKFIYDLHELIKENQDQTSRNTERSQSNNNQYVGRYINKQSQEPKMRLLIEILHRIKDQGRNSNINGLVDSRTLSQSQPETKLQSRRNYAQSQRNINRR